MENKEILIAGVAVTITAYLLTKDIKNTIIIASVHGLAHYMAHSFLPKPDEIDVNIGSIGHITFQPNMSALKRQPRH